MRGGPEVLRSMAARLLGQPWRVLRCGVAETRQPLARGDNRAMLRIARLAVVLVVAGAMFAALAATPPVAVHPRVFVMPLLPAGSEVPMNVPEDGALTMPYVSGGAPGVAARINDTVWREMLDGASAPVHAGDTFTSPPDQLPRGTVSLAYRAHVTPAATPRLLALEFSGEACGAYCENFTHTRVFDLRDGRQISLGDLLTAKGLDTVGRRVDAQRRSAYRQQVRQLKAALKSAPKGRMDSESDDADRLALNQECLKRVAAEPSTREGLLNHSFQLNSRKALVLSIGRCSNHASSALDDVGEITVAVPIATLKAVLTPYGRAVVLHQGDAPPPPGSAGRASRGQ